MRKMKSFYTYIEEKDHDEAVNEWLNENPWHIYSIDNGINGETYPMFYTVIVYEEGRKCM